MQIHSSRFGSSALGRFFIGPMVFLCVSTTVLSQRTVIRNDQVWAQYYTQIRLNDRHSLYVDAGIRRMHTFSLWAQHLLRAGYAYPIANRLQGVSGLAWFSFFSDNRRSREELRVYQELQQPQTVAHVQVQHRLRIEARFFTNLPDGPFSDPRNFNFRFRYRIQTLTPLFRFQGRYPDRKLWLNLSDEIFLNAGKEIVYNAFDNNRFVIGPMLQLSPGLNFSLLYNHQYGGRSKPGTFESSKIFWLTVQHKIGFSKS